MHFYGRKLTFFVKMTFRAFLCGVEGKQAGTGNRFLPRTEDFSSALYGPIRDISGAVLRAKAGRSQPVFLLENPDEIFRMFQANFFGNHRERQISFGEKLPEPVADGSEEFPASGNGP